MGQGGIGVQVGEGAHLRVTLGYAIQAGAYQVNGCKFAASEQGGGLPGWELVQRSRGCHRPKYLRFCVVKKMLLSPVLQSTFQLIEETPPCSPP
jgi:hypothetical protein